MTSIVKDITDDNFEQEVLNSKVPVLLDFWAPWCGPCKMLAPVLIDLAHEMGEKVLICKMNVDENPNTPSKFGIRGLPTMMLFNEGKQVATKTGFIPKESIKQFIESNS